MALQIWLPLNKDIKNYGVSSKNISNSGVTLSSTASKMGNQSGFFDGSSNSILVPFNDYVTTEWSFSCWLYKDQLGESYDTIFGGPSGFEIETRLNSTTTQVIEAHSWGGGTIPYEFNTWYHFAVTRNASETKWYLNGELKFTGSAGSMPTGNYYIGAWRSASEQNFRGYLNDVRIYDECLSIKEIKDIYHGLVVHYPLNQPERNANLVNTSSALVAGGRTAIDNTISGGKFWPTAFDGDTYIRINLTETLVTGTTYTLSCDVENIDSASNITYAINNNSSLGLVKLVNGRIKCTFTPTADLTSPLLFDDIGRTIASSQGTYYCSHFKIEKGTSATPFCPKSSDSPTWSDDIEYDTSGYQHNGTVNSTPTLSTDSIRNNACYVFDGTDDAILVPFNTVMGSNTTWSLSVWFYKDSLGTKGYNTIFGGPSGFEIEATDSSRSGYKIVAYNWGGSSFEYSSGAWHHLVVVRTTSDTKWYLDNTLKLTGSAGSIPSGNYYIASWNTSTQQNYCGKLSDFRIYTTALTTTDIQELYNAPITITNTGTLVIQGEMIEG